MDAQIGLVRALLPATAALQVRIPPDHPSVEILGEERMGTAAVVEPGLLLTVNYVVIGGRRIQATLPDGQTASAEIVAQDYETGLALLRAPLPAGPVAVPGDSRALARGQEVFILGATGSTERRVSNGVVTDLGPFDATWEYLLESAIQTSAFNPGFGGGPLFTRQGRLVGITSLGLGQVGRFSLAIPVHLYLEARGELLRFGRVRDRVRRAWLGLFTETTPAGLLVAGVVPRAPAAEAGIREGDLIHALNFREVATRLELYRELWKHPAGTVVRVGLYRGEESTILEVPSADRAEFYR